MTELKYFTGGLSAGEVSAEVDRLWRELQREDALLRRRAEESGIDLAAIEGLKREEVIIIRPEGEGLDPGTIALIVAFVAPVAVKVTTDLWTHILLPRIKERFGPNRLRQKDELNRPPSGE